MFNIAVQGAWTGSLQEPFGDTPVANIFGEELETDWDGNFVLWISPEPHPGNWIQSRPGVRKIFYRQYFDTWDEIPASYRIERIGDDAEDLPPALEPARAARVVRAGRRIRRRRGAQDWPERLWERIGVYEARELLRASHGEERRLARTTSDRRPAGARSIIEELNWDVPPDEALIIEFESRSRLRSGSSAPCTVFGASLEFRYRQVNLTSGMSPVDPDGTTRIVISHADPGFANWLDTQEHTARMAAASGTCSTRSTPELRTRRVAASELEREIGTVATRITPAERVAELRRRRAANLRRYPI